MYKTQAGQIHFSQLSIEFCRSETLQAKLPMKYSYLMALDVLDILKQEKSLQRVAVPPGSKTSDMSKAQFFSMSFCDLLF